MVTAICFMGAAWCLMGIGFLLMRSERNYYRRMCEQLRASNAVLRQGYRP